jgi:hypothetical protein
MKQVALLAVLIICAVWGSAQSPDFSDPQTAEGMVKQISNVAGLSTHFKLKTSDKVVVSEAYIRHRKHYILYNPIFFNGVSRITNDKWATIALLAHEIGHHVKKHTARKGGNAHEIELQADEFAGVVLRKMGATLEQAQAVMYYISTIKGSTSHPGREDRLLAISRGWNNTIGNTMANLAKSSL